MSEVKDVQDVIDDVIVREGGAKTSNDPADKGSRTQYGISERANPKAWEDGKVTEAEAREIYERKYIRYPGFDKITDKRLQSQLIDFGVNSGSFLAIQELQKILHVNADGILGPKTLEALSAANPKVVNNALVVSRLKMIGRLLVRNPNQHKFALGWISRCCEFLV